MFFKTTRFYSPNDGGGNGGGTGGNPDNSNPENKDPNGEPNKGDKDPEGDPNKTPEGGQATFTQEQVNSLIKQSKDKYKNKITELENKLKEFEPLQGKLTEAEGKLQGFADYEEVKGSVEKYKTTITNILNKRLEAVPETYRDLIPQTDEVAKIEWIENAFSKGLFNAPANPNGGSNPNNNNNGGVLSMKDSTVDDFIQNMLNKKK